VATNPAHVDPSPDMVVTCVFLMPGLWRTTGLCLIVFLILALSVNVCAAINHVQMGGHGIGSWSIPWRDKQ
jgi:hypothetical protein